MFIVNILFLLVISMQVFTVSQIFSFDVLDLSNSQQLAVLGAFGKPYVRGINRIGPHDIKILELIYGIALGDGSFAKATDTVSFKFNQSIIHKQFFDSISWKLFQSG